MHIYDRHSSMKLHIDADYTSQDIKVKILIMFALDTEPSQTVFCQENLSYDA